MSYFLNLVCTPSVNAAMQQNHIPVIRDIELMIPEDGFRGPFQLKISSSPAFFTEQVMHIDPIEPGVAWHSGPWDLPLQWPALIANTESVNGILMLELTGDDDRVLHTREHDIRILPFDQWQGADVLPELLASFITPNHPKITGLLQRASEILGGWTGKPGLDGYQSQNPDRIRKQAAAMYSAITEMNLTYLTVPASFEQRGQRIRLCDQLFAQGMGNCLDMSLLFAACAEAAGLHPLVVVIKGHAFPGLWLADETFGDPVNDDLTLLTKRMAEGIHDIVLLEATGMNKGAGLDFESAVRAASAHLQTPEDFMLFLDVQRARHGKIRPLPLRVLTPDGWRLTEPEQQERTSEIPATIQVGQKPLSPVDTSITRQQIWERKLLDLSLRNNLLNVRLTRGQIQLISPLLSEMEDSLSRGDELQLFAKPADWDNPYRDAGIYRKMNAADPLFDLVSKELAQKRLRCYLPEEELQKSLTDLYRSSRLSLEENGANTLFLVLGLLKWYESDASERPRYAPLLLMPVEIVRKSSQKGFVIRSREEETFANITLLEMLRQDFDIKVTGLDILPRDKEGIDVKTAFNFYRHAIMSRPRWDVEELAFIGQYSFSKFVMWNDIHKHAEKLVQNKVVDSLLQGRLTWGTEAAPGSVKPLDELEPTEILLPITADGSQMEAVRTALSGESFVLHGPPGTGKSQTITNIIANALYRGKRVLFVAEKMAALEVVEKRLEEIGLGNFCLELHSNKAKKTNVLQQLKRMTDQQHTASAGNFAAEARRLHSLRGELNEYAQALHRERRSGLSVYESISRYVPHMSATGNFSFDRELIRNITPEQLTVMLDLIRDMEVALGSVGDPASHPLAGVGLTKYESHLRESIPAACQKLLTEMEALRARADVVLPALGISAVLHSGDHYRYISGFLGCLLEMPDFNGRLLLPEYQGRKIDAMRELMAAGRKAKSISEGLAVHYSPQWRQIDAEKLLQEWKMSDDAWFIPRFFIRRRIRRQLAASAVSHPIQSQQVTDHLERMVSFRQPAQELAGAETLMAPLFEGYWKGVDTDWESLSAILDGLGSVNGIMMKVFPGIPEMERWKSDFSRNLGAGSRGWLNMHAAQITGYIEVCDTVSKTDERLSELIRYTEPASPAIGKDWIAERTAAALRWKDGVAHLRHWCSWVQVKENAIRAGLESAVSFIEKGYPSSQHISDIILKNLYRSMTDQAIDEEPVLGSFNGNLFDEKVRRFMDLNRSFESITRSEIVATLAARMPNLPAQAARSSEVSILQRAIANNGRGISIRQLFEQIPNLLTSLCPCMLMSPISVAQYLSLDHTKFDLVIFDEASQMPTSEAIGAIARGRDLVVVGDPRQMPPTNFFSTATYDEENADKEDLESILDDCLSLSMPNRYLSWHYRSRHESLIAFSNAKYYENRLLTFPSSEEIISRVKLVPVDGYYDRGRSKHNVAEAKAIVAEVVRRALDPASASQSLGIVTFNSVQQKLIQDLMDEAILRDPLLEAALLCVQEPIFIKNLENVQGDERDVILFSVGYGKDREGRIFLNFGPLNREGGWRRLNVAVSRARYEMIVYSTLRPEDIDLGRTSSEGVAGLRAFLQYAAKGAGTLPVSGTTIDKTEDSTLCSEIAGSLKALGHGIHTRVGCSGFRIDIAMLHPDHPSRYLLAVLLDGRGFAGSATASDRHLGKRKVLEQLGWQVHQVWSSDWWEDPRSVIDGIVTVFRQAAGHTAVPKVSEGVEDLKMPGDSPDDGLEVPIASAAAVRQTAPGIPGRLPYTAASLDQKKSFAPEDFLLHENKPVIGQQIRTVMQAEAPVTRSLLYKRIIDAWGIARTGVRIQRHLDEMLALMNYYITRQGLEEVLWLPGQDPDRLESFRVPEDDGNRREAEDLPVHEVAVAAQSLVRMHFSLTEEDLVRELVRIFGYARTGTSVEQAMKEGIRTALILGKFRQEGGRYRI